MTIDTYDSSISDTILYVSEGVCAPDGDALVACNDDGDVGFLSEVTFEATLGTTYFIFVEEWGGGAGDIAGSIFRDSAE